MKKITFILCFSFVAAIFQICQAQNISIDQLEETDEFQSRDISLPGARIVINPYDYHTNVETTASQYCNAPNLPLNIGFLGTERNPDRLCDNLLSIYNKNTNNTESALYTKWRADLMDKSKWNNQSQTNLIVTPDGELKFLLYANPDPLWKALSNRTPISINFDNKNHVVLKISDFKGERWSFKMRDENGREVVLRKDKPGSGIFEYDLSSIGWTGTHQITFDIYCVGKASFIVLNDLKVFENQGENQAQHAADYATSWYPHMLPFSATYPDKSSLTGRDFFFDKQTIIRQLEFAPDQDLQKIIMGGAYSGKSISYNENILLIEKSNYKIAIGSDFFKNSEIIYYNSLIELEKQMNGSEIPGKMGYWAIEARVEKQRKYNTAISFAYKNDNETPGIIIEKTKEVLRDNNADLGLTAQIQYWNELLSIVPHPADFVLRSVEAKDVKPEIIRKDYYKAWCFLASNILDPDYLKFNYPQIVTGKASMWDEGDVLCPYSASWESFLGIQLYAFIDPEIAWKAFEGIMSLTDNEGKIGGESLPSRKAQTAWILYHITKDADRLKASFEPLERYLNWRLKYPHWILNSNPDTTRKDAEFAFSIIKDIDFMKEICRVIKTEQDVIAWESKQKKFFNECQSWFWSTPKAYPVQLYNTATQSRESGHTYWVTTGLYMNELSGDYLNSMLKRFNFNFNPNQSMGGSGMGWPKYPDISYTAYGLIEKNNIVKAEQVIEVGIRDIVRSGHFFAEQYETTATPFPAGVRPSLFGACQIIDFVMIKNGFRYDKGNPIALFGFNENGGVSNIRYDQKILNIEKTNENTINITGSYVDKPKQIKGVKGQYFIIYPNDSDTHSPIVDFSESNIQVFGKNDGFDIAFSNIEGDVSLNILDLNGKSCLKRCFHISQDKEIVSIDFPLKGMKILFISTKDHFITKKIMIR